MKEAFYFSHDYNARQDPKIKKLIMSQGFESYGLFWAIIEDLYNNANALPLDYESIAYDLRVSENVIDSIINDFDLFVFDVDTFGSLSVQKRLDERNDKSVKARESANKRWKNANALQTQYDSNAIKERKGKEIKERKEIKEINISFDIFWDLYDKKNGDKAKLIVKWNNFTDLERKEIIEYIPKYKLSQPDKKFRKDPQTFFNNNSWNDELIGLQPEVKNNIAKRQDAEFEEYKARMLEIQNK